MPYSSSRITAITVFLLTVDALCIVISAFFAYYMTSPAEELPFLFEKILAGGNYFICLFLVWFWVGSYQGVFISHRKDPLIPQVYGAVKAVLITLVFSDFLGTVLIGYEPPARFIWYYGGAMLVTITGFRVLLCFVLWIIREWGFNQRNILLVGANLRTEHLIEIILSHTQYGYNIMGILEDEVDRLKVLERFNIPHMGRINDLEDVLQEHVVDEVHVCLPVRSFYEQIQALADICMSVGVSMRLVADLFPLRLATSRLHRLEGIPMLSLTMVTESATQLAAKRFIDILGSLFFITLLSPLFIVTIIAIRLDSPGPIFFLQERIGRNQRKFNMIKFRSMVINAEEKKKELEKLNEADGPIFKIRRDPRITRVGRFIRKYSVDEMPQLFNVLRGEMSLVGPRPHPTHEVARYAFNQRRRLSVKPGMTGLAQVNGRSDLSWDESLRLDLNYIDNWSLMSDFSIALKTFQAVLSAKGAT